MRRWGDTPNFSRPSLCESCQWAHISKGTSSDAIVACRALSYSNPAQITFKIFECTSYSERGKGMSRNDMEQMAWILDTGPVKPIGFAGGGEVKFVSPLEREQKPQGAPTK